MSAIVSTSDRGSSFRRVSTSAAATDDDMLAEMPIDNHSSSESFIPMVITEPEFVAVHATYARQSEEHSDQQPHHGISYVVHPPSTQNSSSPASSVSDQNIQDTSGAAESATSPQSTADTQISTFVIYTPDEMRASSFFSFCTLNSGPDPTTKHPERPRHQRISKSSSIVFRREDS